MEGKSLPLETPLNLDPRWLKHVEGAVPTEDDRAHAMNVHILDFDGGGGNPGPEGKSAYQVWLDNGNTGTVNDYLQSLQGPTGATGLPGERGDKGDTGAAGAKGDKGDTGPKGDAGPKGDTGTPGAKGDKGDTGDKGDVGEPGRPGSPDKYVEKVGDLPATPPEGDYALYVTEEFGHIHVWKADTGTWTDLGQYAGTPGSPGAKGDRGDKGDTGAPGAKGDKGDPGAKGDPGPKGDKGDAGPKGDKGDRGEDGTAAWGTDSVKITSNYVVSTRISTVYVAAAQDRKVSIDLPTAASYGTGRILVIKDMSGTVHSSHPVSIWSHKDDGIDGSREYVMGRPHGYVILLCAEESGVNSWQVIGSPLPGLNYTILDWSWIGGFRPNRPVNNSTLGGAHMYVVSNVRILEPKGRDVSVWFEDFTTDRTGQTPGSVDPTKPNAPVEAILNTEVNKGYAFPETKIRRHINQVSMEPSKSFPLRVTNLSDTDFPRVVLEFKYQVISDVTDIHPELPETT